MLPSSPLIRSAVLDGFAAAAAAAAALLWLLDSYTHLSPSPLYYVINIYTSSIGVSTLWYVCMSRFCVLWNEHWRNKLVIDFFRTELTCCYPHLRLHPKIKMVKAMHVSQDHFLVSDAKSFPYSKVRLLACKMLNFPFLDIKGAYLWWWWSAELFLFQGVLQQPSIAVHKCLRLIIPVCKFTMMKDHIQSSKGFTQALHNHEQRWMSCIVRLCFLLEPLVWKLTIPLYSSYVQLQCQFFILLCWV
jgi:hypothetical protein